MSVSPGDVIIGLAGRAVNNAADLVNVLDDLQAGQAVEVQYLRSGGGIEVRELVGGWMWGCGCG